MTVKLKPEIVVLIQKQLQSGEFSTPEEVIERALAFLGAEDDWLTDHRVEIAAQVQEGWDEAQRGDLTGDETVQSEMRRFKEDWKNRHEPVSSHVKG
jgi:Arc/MetJ-type ribon-helix-helix transcriptional regulator